MQANPNQGAYVASKYAIVGFTEALRKDLAEEDVSVSVLCPWFVDTPIMYGGLDDDDLEGIAKRREALGDWYKEAASPDLVGEQVADAILKDELFIVCNGGWTRKLIEARTNDVFDAPNRQISQ